MTFLRVFQICAGLCAISLTALSSPVCADAPMNVFPPCHFACCGSAGFIPCPPVNGLNFTEQAAGKQELGVLVGTKWRMVRFESSDDSVIYPDKPDDFTVEFSGDGNAYFKIDVNRASGPWISTEEGGLVFGMLRMTLAAFTPSAFLDRWLKDIESIRSYIIRDGRLYLAVKYDSGIYELEAVERD